MSKVKYIGGYPEVVVALPSGDRTVQHGQVIDITTDERDELVKQETNWQAVEPAAKEKSA